MYVLIPLIAVLFGLLLSGVWIGVALGITGIVLMQFWGGGITVLGNATWNALDVYALSAILGFVFMGQIILHSGLSARIYQSVSPLMARLPGKLLHSNILISALFAAVLGASTANAAVVGSVAIPELRARNYNDRMVLGTVCSGGTLGILIPPSTGFILYAVMADQSVAALFAAGTIPGVVMAILFMVWIGIKGMLTPSIAPVAEKSMPILPTLLSLVRLWPLLLLMFACVGTIYLGWATPAEGAGIGAAASIIVGRLFGKLNWHDIKTSLPEAARISAMIFFLVLGAMLLSVSISSLGLPREIVMAISELPLSPMQIMCLILMMYLVMGCFLDGISMTVTTLPFMVPVVASLGFDLVWFGVAFIIMCEIGQVTPPVGLNLFVVQGIAGRDTSISSVAIGAFPFVLITAGVLALVTAFPEIIEYLPRLLHLL